MKRFLLGVCVGALLGTEGLGLVIVAGAAAAAIAGAMWLVTLPFRWAWWNRDGQMQVTCSRIEL